MAKAKPRSKRAPRGQRPPPHSSGSRLSQGQTKRSGKASTPKRRRLWWQGLLAELLGVGRPIGEEHDGVFVSGKHVYTLTDKMKDRLMCKKNPEKTLLLLYVLFEKACALQPGVIGGGSGLFNAKIYVSDLFDVPTLRIKADNVEDGVPTGVKTPRCRSIMRSTRLYSLLQDGVIRIPCVSHIC
jgi:hypothetical protein